MCGYTRRTLYRYVDWNIDFAEASEGWDGRTLYRYVDWNILLTQTAEQ